jgi:hypothetical protein
VRHAQFLVDAAATAVNDAELGEVLTQDTVRQMLQTLSHKADGLLHESHLVWAVWLGWEQDAERVHGMYLERLKVPHTALQSTFDGYSSFCTANAPNDYEARLVAATAASQSAKAVLFEKRFGKTRSDLEDGGDYGAYLDWELKAKTPNAALIKPLFERAVVAEPALWSRYAQWSVSERATSLMQGDVEVYQRAVRACPGGSLWSELFIEMVSLV